MSREEGKSKRKTFFTALFSALLIAGLGLPSARAAGTQNVGPVPVSAEVPSSLELVVTIRDALTNAVVPTMAFGELLPDTGDYRARTFYLVTLQVFAGGNAHEVSQNGTLLSRNEGGETIPSGAFNVSPFYDSAVNSGLPQPPGSAVSSAGSAVGLKLLYSDPSGNNRTVSAFYTLSGDPNTGATQQIPLSQKSGAYSGAVQFTLTTT